MNEIQGDEGGHGHAHHEEEVRVQTHFPHPHHNTAVNSPLFSIFRRIH